MTERLTKVAGISGIAGIVLLFIANAQLGTPPKAEDSAQKIVSFLADKRGKVLTFVVLFAVGYILLLTFVAALREVLKSAGDPSALPDISFAGAVWVAGVGTIGLAALGAAAFRAPSLEPGTTQALFDVNNIAFALLGAPFAALFGAASISAMSTRVFPRWVTWVGLLIVVLNVVKLFTLFTRSGGFAPGGGLSIVAVVPIWIWTIAVGVLMIRGIKSRTAPA